MLTPHISKSHSTLKHNLGIPFHFCNRTFLPLREDEKQELLIAHHILLKPIYQNPQAFLNPEQPIDLVNLAIENAQASLRADPSEVNWCAGFAKALVAMFNHEWVEKFYKECSQTPMLEPLRQGLIDALPEDLSLRSALAHIPNRYGCRQSQRLEEQRLDLALDNLTVKERPDPYRECVVTLHRSSGISYFDPSMLEYIVDFNALDQGKGLLLDHHSGGQNTTESLHRVVKVDRSGRSIHLKELPTFPLMEYAIYELMHRLFGRGASPCELLWIKVERGGKAALKCSVLATLTIPGKTLAETTPHPSRLDPVQITEMLIAALITTPIDGHRSNYILNKKPNKRHHIICVDNEAVFGDPAIKEDEDIVIQFKSVLFSYKGLVRTLAPEALKSLIALKENLHLILQDWLTSMKDLQACTQNLFENFKDDRYSYDGIVIQHSADPEKKCYTRLMLKPGALLRAKAQIEHLQTVFADWQEKRIKATPIDLLQELIGLSPEARVNVGKLVAGKYQKGLTLDEPEHKRLAYTLGEARKTRWSNRLKKSIVSEGSKTTTQTLAAIFGGLSTAKNLEKFSLANAQAEIAGHESGVMIGNFRGERVDEVYEHLFLKICERLSNINHLDISHSSTCNIKQLLRILKNNPHLKSLNMSSCKKIEYLKEGQNKAIILPSLEYLYADYCPNLRDMNLNASNLNMLHAAHCPNLQLALEAPVLRSVTLSGSPVTGISDITTLKKLNLEKSKVTDKELMPILKQNIFEELNLNGCLHIWEALEYIESMGNKPKRLNIKETGPAFGKACWESYFGVDIGEEPPLPLDIFEQLSAKCPLGLDPAFGDLMWQTHVLVLVPSHITKQGEKDTKELTLKRLERLIKHKLQASSKRYFGEEERTHMEFYHYNHNKVCVEKNTWILLSKGVLKDSCGKSYSAQVRQVAELASRSGINYRVPKLIEVCVAMYIHHIRTGETLYVNHPSTCMRCQEGLSASYPTVAKLGTYGGRINWGYIKGGVGAVWEVPYVG